MINDTGSDTLRRYLYQAEITLRVCLELLPTDSSTAVIVPEYIEDICIERHDASLRLLQVKTRNADLGSWRCSDLLAEQGGALKGVLRSFKYCEEHSLAASFELFLEGAAAPNDPFIQLLKAGSGHEDKKLVAYVAKRLEISSRVAKKLLQKVVVVFGLPPRESITAENQARLGRISEGLLYDELIELHADIVALIIRAMCGRLDASNISNNELLSLSSDHRTVRDGKSITPEVFSSTVRGRINLASGLALELASGDPGTVALTNLRFKLLQRQASASTLMEALKLRMLAREWRDSMRHAAADVFAARRPTVQQVMLSIVQGELDKRNKISGDEAFSVARETIGKKRSKIDPSSVFERNPNVLLGELCEISERCGFEWKASA